MKQSPNNIKQSYKKYADEQVIKRFKSGNSLRDYAHNTELKSIIKSIKKTDKIIDVGCGEGMLTLMLAKKGVGQIVGMDITPKNIKNAKNYSKNENLKITYLVGDAENVNFPDNSFDIVTSTHVLEHLPNISLGAKELYRLTKKRAIVAMPTILNPCSIVQCGYSQFYKKTFRSFMAFPIGFIRMIFALILFREGVNEGYGPEKLPHVWRFPWAMKKILENAGFKVTKIEASNMALPYFESFVPLSKKLDYYKHKWPLKYFGYGTIMYCEK